MKSVSQYLSVLGLCGTAYGFETLAWQNIHSNVHQMTFPEDSYADIASKSNVGISFSGGGDRSFTASIGYLAGIHELGVMENIKYMVGVSGGSWATMVYSYYQDDSISDDTMLGPVIFPADIVRDDLQEMESGCVRAYPSTDYKWTDGYTFEDNSDGIQYIYLDPSGIGRGNPFSYNDDSVADILSRNPNLSSESFVKVRGTNGASFIDPRPYPIAITTMVGPYDMLPAKPDNREYTALEYSPLSIGVVHTKEYVYKEADDITDTRIKTVGGLVEPYAFGGDVSPSLGLGSGEHHGRISVPDTEVIADLALAIGGSSYAAGCFYASSSLEGLQNNVGIYPYFSPSHTTPSTQAEDMALADGAGVQNTNVISLLQRNVENMILFVSTSVPMQMSDSWNPESDTLTGDYIDFTIPALFGHIASDLSSISESSFDLEGSQVFSYDEWVPLAKAMQEKQAEGRGIVVSTQHTTVSNTKYGISAGRVVNVVWVYLGRSSLWESQLSQDMQDLVIPENDPENLANTRENGPFKKFPHYTTTVASINKEKANLLADYTGWLIHEHSTEIANAISSESSGSSSEDPEFYDTEMGLSVVISIGVVGAAIVGAVLLLKFYRNGKANSPHESNVDGDREMTTNPVISNEA